MTPNSSVHDALTELTADDRDLIVDAYQADAGQTVMRLAANRVTDNVAFRLTGCGVAEASVDTGGPHGGDIYGLERTALGRDVARHLLEQRLDDPIEPTGFRTQPAPMRRIDDVVVAEQVRRWIDAGRGADEIINGDVARYIAGREGPGEAATLVTFADHGTITLRLAGDVEALRARIDEDNDGCPDCDAIADQIHALRAYIIAETTR